MNGERVGTWSLPARGPQQFTYAESWLHSSQFRPLSLSLPAGLGATALTGSAVESWFDNLLPDSDAIRRRAQARFQAASTSAFDLLAAVGRDCAGAVQLLPPDQEPSGIDRIEARPLSNQEIGQRLRAVTAAPAPGSLGPESDELRFSVAGAQEKTAFLLHDSQWCLPLASTPTTHLFKLPMGVIGEGQIDFSTSVDNEWLCSKVLKAYGLPVASTEMASFDGERCLIVQRFDRRLHASGAYWLRLPTEDCCQATSTPASNKYENNGGPGMVAIAALLAQSSERSDLASFFKAQVLFWMLRAIDGHAKNFSLFLNPGGRFQLTPLYDVLSAWPVIGNRSGQWPQQKLRMAMAWNGETGRYYKPLEITGRRMLLTAKRLGLGDAQPLLHELIAQTPTVIAAVQAQLPADFPQTVAEPVFTGLQTSASQLQRELI
ncbi:type II toxin-antitoxin system HipA family toxin [Vulcanococcus limneticus Candia 3F8]|nr:type II toxin-antitoxin system HipA family toxin [Vulcanococcus limneticus MW73D5]MCP9895329.1 type II toxin-antitoxin system HipA family toxin [Vulcanococcus limneticus Candia 3F8]MCP9898725.1 type II toxin-antitoxin system HipA family toxin [Vulcanococcus limneticus Candia 3B3]